MPHEEGFSNGQPRCRPACRLQTAKSLVGVVRKVSEVAAAGSNAPYFLRHVADYAVDDSYGDGVDYSLLIVRVEIAREKSGVLSIFSSISVVGKR